MQICNFPNIGYIMNTFTNEELHPIRNEVAEIHSTFQTAQTVDHSFAGAIKKDISGYEAILILKNS